MTQAPTNSADAASLAALIAHRKPGHMLPRPFYIDAGIFQRDVERIHLGHWILAGHTASIPRHGDYFLYDIGFESLIVLRATNGDVHALVNVCRHRGSRVCVEEYGCARTLVCPYHGWTYDHAGMLVTAPDAPQNLDFSAHSLRAARVLVVEGLIFVDLSGDGDFASAAAATTERLAGHRLADTRIAYHRRYLCPANWKLVVDSFIELQASGSSHPEMRRVMARSNAASAHERDGRMAHLESYGRLTYEAFRETIRPGFNTQSEDGRPLAPPLGDLAAHDGQVTAIRVLGSWLIVNGDYAVLLRVTPIEPQVTEMDVTWLVSSSAVEGSDYDAPRLAWLWKSNVERTLKLATDNQLGVNSRQFVPGPYGNRETGLDRFATWYLSRLA